MPVRVLYGDVDTAFYDASKTSFAKGNTCMAGLLNPANPQTDPPTCDVHPSVVGHKLIANVVTGLMQSPHEQPGNNHSAGPAFEEGEHLSSRNSVPQ